MNCESDSREKLKTVCQKSRNLNGTEILECIGQKLESPNGIAADDQQKKVDVSGYPEFKENSRGFTKLEHGEPAEPQGQVRNPRTFPMMDSSVPLLNPQHPLVASIGSLPDPANFQIHRAAIPNMGEEFPQQHTVPIIPFDPKRLSKQMGSKAEQGKSQQRTFDAGDPGLSISPFSPWMTPFGGQQQRSGSNFLHFDPLPQNSPFPALFSDPTHSHSRQFQNQDSTTDEFKTQDKSDFSFASGSSSSQTVPESEHEFTSGDSGKADGKIMSLDSGKTLIPGAAAAAAAAAAASASASSAVIEHKKCPVCPSFPPAFQPGPPPSYYGQYAPSKPKPSVPSQYYGPSAPSYPPMSHNSYSGYWPPPQQNPSYSSYHSPQPQPMNPSFRPPSFSKPSFQPQPQPHQPEHEPEPQPSFEDTRGQLFRAQDNSINGRKTLYNIVEPDPNKSVPTYTLTASKHPYSIRLYIMSQNNQGRMVQVPLNLIVKCGKNGHEKDKMLRETNPNQTPEFPTTIKPTEATSVEPTKPMPVKPDLAEKDGGKFEKASNEINDDW